MASQPDIYNLVWSAFSFVSRPDPSKGVFQVAPEHLNTIETRANIPAVILFPSLLTPNLHVLGENEGKIEILVAAPSSPALTPDDVNRHLKFAPGLDAKKSVSDDDLFDDPKGKITVDPVHADPLGQLKTTSSIFRGILHTTVSNWLPEELDAFYSIQIDESGLSPSSPQASSEADDGGGSGNDAHDGGDGASSATAAGSTASDSSSSESGTSSTLDDSGALEYQDFLIAGVLQRINGPGLQGKGGFGKHEFAFDDEGVDYSQVDLDQPIVAYHPLYVYPAGSLQSLNIGHVADIHINARQKLLAKSPARVIDADSAADESPAIGSMMNTFERSFLSILDALEGKGIDVLLIGGDLIEHVDNAFPYHDGFDADKLRDPSAATIWDLVDVDNNYGRNYHSYVDYLAFFTAIRHFCRKPVFAVAGNHDCYKANHLYGISPRLMLGFKKANEGIPADHNLTFYEAMLAFGESWDSVSLGLSFGKLFDPQYYEWFHAVLTPFSDFNLELPKVRWWVWAGARAKSP